LKCGTQEDAAKFFAWIRNTSLQMVGGTVVEADQDVVRVSWDDGSMPNLAAFRFNFDKPPDAIPHPGDKIIISGTFANQKVLVFGLQNLQAINLHIRGILGEDFLDHFDMLLDNGHNLLCLDEAGAMRASVKGPHVALAQAAGGATVSNSLIVEAHLSDGKRPVRLWLDSGSNVAFLYNPSEYLGKGSVRNASLQGTAGNAAQQSLSALAAQDVKIGPTELLNVSFLTPVAGQENSSITEFDGLLTTWLFKRVFINHADHFAGLEPW
jgi:hypothetical protein